MALQMNGTLTQLDLRDNSIGDKEDVVSEAKRNNETVHFGNIMTIVSEKFAETREELQILKGHFVFRGDVVRDQNSGLGVFKT